MEGFGVFQPAIFSYESQNFASFRIANNSHCYGDSSGALFFSYVGLCNITKDENGYVTVAKKCWILKYPDLIDDTDPALVRHPNYFGLEDARPFILENKVYLVGTMNFIRKSDGQKVYDYQQVAIARLDRNLGAIEHIGIVKMGFIPQVRWFDFHFLL
jgi:hypothetical protein